MFKRARRPNRRALLFRFPFSLFTPACSALLYAGGPFSQAQHQAGTSGLRPPGLLPLLGP